MKEPKKAEIARMRKVRRNQAGGKKTVCGQKDPKVSAYQQVRENRNEFLSVTSKNMLRCDACKETISKKKSTVHRVSTSTPSRKIVIKRDIRPSHKMKLGQYLSEIDWHLIKLKLLCDQKCKFLCSAIMTGYNILMPEKQVKIHQNDPLWISEELKHLITLCQVLSPLGTMLCSYSIRTRSTA